jgi:hypothetical protein
MVEPVWPARKLTRGTNLSTVGAGVGELVVGAGVGELVVGAGVGELVVGAGVGEMVVGTGVVGGFVEALGGFVWAISGEVGCIVSAGLLVRIVSAGLLGWAGAGVVGSAGLLGSAGVAGLIGWVGVVGSVGATIDREVFASSSLPVKTMTTGTTTAMTTNIRASKIYILLAEVPLTLGWASSFLSSSNRTFLSESFLSRSTSSAPLERSEVWVAGVPTTLTSLVDGVEGGEDSSNGRDVSSSSGSWLMVG